MEYSQTISLNGSVEYVVKYLSFAVNKILYERGIYPEEKFTERNIFGFTRKFVDIPEIVEYLNHFFSQLSVWLLKEEVDRVVLVIGSIKQNQDLERWQFQINTRTQSVAMSTDNVNSEVHGIDAQINSCITTMIPLEELCSFNLIVYANTQCDTPQNWHECNEHYISNAEECILKSVSTPCHEVNLAFCYKQL
ncbi:mitotic spindle assembly checkpoint protein MAD2A isoform X1 [Hydra vulgaris]|uniref:mitotic spindle assembly checkpoint protein MAD2A isoform X1 n=1 Tax=Hydra vulgaris TaxID=6087 RepID=UPI000192602B|nr:mitotic spindle assembly checkpoint protein MAD2A-like isoform X2 [Hydra vulgaris]